MRSRNSTLVNRAPQSRTNVVQRAHLMREVIEVIIFVVLVFLIVHFALAVRTIVDPKMSPALKQGQWVAINQIAYIFGTPSRGELVLMADPSNNSNVMIRRVIGLPGDTITLTATTVAVNGVTLTESYVQANPGVPANPVVGNFTVPKDSFYVLGDNRTEADDSRQFGMVPRQNISGKALAVYWPLSSFHFLSDYAAVFSNVPHR
ncbi:MAG TPA: signal peptidase I [Ktedonobacterales bacterium]